MSKFSLVLILLISFVTTAYAQNHTGPGGGDPDPEVDRGETCRHLLRTSERYERAFVESHLEKYNKEEDFFNLLSKVTLKNDLKILEKGLLPGITVDDCHVKVKSDLGKIKALYVEAIRPDQSCNGFKKRQEHIKLIDEVMKLYGK